MKMFELLVKMGFKEIEIGFPSASQTDFDFVRQLVTEDRIPDDVTGLGAHQAREDLIARTVESLQGADKATVHLYNATAPLFQRVVFNVTRGPSASTSRSAAPSGRMKRYAEQLLSAPDIGYRYSPEIFTQTPTDFALGSAGGSPTCGSRRAEIILNLPATVEIATPNTYADQIEGSGAT